MCKESISNYWGNIMYIPISIKVNNKEINVLTHEMCQIAYNQNKKALKYIPKKWKDKIIYQNNT